MNLGIAFFEESSYLGSYVFEMVLGHESVVFIQCEDKENASNLSSQCPANVL